jgi:actin-related protein
MELEKFEQKQVAVISKLQARSDELKLIATKTIVKNDDTLKEANQLIKDINAHKKDVNTKRLELTQPLNNVVSQLIAKEKEVLLPLDEAKTELSDKIIDYSAEVERKRLAEIERIDTIVNKIYEYGDLSDTIEHINLSGKSLKEYFAKLPEVDQNNPTIKVAFMTTVGKLSDRKTAIEAEERAEQERIRQAAEQKKLDEMAAKQSEEENRLAAERKANDDAKRELEEQKLQMERDKKEMERQKEIQLAEAEQLRRDKVLAKITASRPKTNQVTSTKFTITDENMVDRLLCSPDDKKIREAIKAGAKELAGIRIFEETKVR